MVTVGNELRGDDAAGPYFASIIADCIDKTGNILINAGTVPENFTGLIRREKPSHIIIVDAVEMNMEPGTIRVIPKESIAEYSVSTHAMPLSFLVRYLERSGDYKIILIGIQPETLEFGRKLNKNVEKALNNLKLILSDILLNLNSP